MGTTIERRISSFNQGIYRISWIFVSFFKHFCFRSQYVQSNKDSGTDWFRLESNKEGTKWFGTCWCMHNLLKYEFQVEFDVSREGALIFRYHKFKSFECDYWQMEKMISIQMSNQSWEYIFVLEKMIFFINSGAFSWLSWWALTNGTYWY